jgi:hypothetical protein
MKINNLMQDPLFEMGENWMELRQRFVLTGGGHATT